MKKHPVYPNKVFTNLEWQPSAPSHWSRMRFRFQAELNPSKSEARMLGLETDASFLAMESIGDDGKIDASTTRKIKEVLSGYTYFREGDVAIAKITPCFENGKGAIMNGLKNQIGFGTTELRIL